MIELLADDNLEICILHGNEFEITLKSSALDNMMEMSSVLSLSLYLGQCLENQYMARGCL